MMPATRGGVEAALGVHMERANWLCVMELKKSGWILSRQSNKKWHRASWWLSWQSVTLDVLQVFFCLSCHMPPPSPLSHRCCHSPLSPNKHMQNAQQTYRDTLKTGTTFLGTRLALGVCINTLPKRWGIVFTFLETLYCRKTKKSIHHLERETHKRQGCLRHALIAFHGAVLHVWAAIRGTRSVSHSGYTHGGKQMTLIYFLILLTLHFSHKKHLFLINHCSIFVLHPVMYNKLFTAEFLFCLFLFWLLFPTVIQHRASRENQIFLCFYVFWCSSVLWAKNVILKL